MQKFSIPLEVQREDRIFGPLTMRRLIILCVGGGITYVFYLWLRPHGSIIWGGPVLIGTTLTLCIAFLELFGMRFEKLLIRFLEFTIFPRVRVWDKQFSQNVFFQFISYKASLKSSKKENSKKSLHSIWQEKAEKLSHITKN